jgi:predicted dehydrogenase
MQAETATYVSGFDAQRHPQTVAPYQGSKTGGHGGLIRDFVECVASGRIPETICTDNIKSLAMVFGAIESAEAGGPVNI